MHKILWASVALFGLALQPVQAKQVSVPVNTIDAQGIGAVIGHVVLADTAKGLRITPKLSGLRPGPHGFHIHENGSCAPTQKDGQSVPGLAAGGHYDPSGSKAHRGPYSKDGHLGDLPALSVNGDGTARDAVTAPRLKLKDVKGRAIIIHAGMDNYADTPEPLGGGAARIACGVIP